MERHKAQEYLFRKLKGATLRFTRRGGLFVHFENLFWSSRLNSSNLHLCYESYLYLTAKKVKKGESVDLVTLIRYASPAADFLLSLEGSC